MTRDSSHDQGKNKAQTDKTPVEAGELEVDGMKVVFEIETVEPRTTLDERLKVEQTRALFDLLQDVIARRSQ
jgi:hypothetical protein